MRRTLKILLYGDIDLNFIDGSAVWLTSIAHVLNMNQNIKVDLLLKSRMKNPALFTEIQALSGMRIIKPYEKYPSYSFSNRNRLNVDDAVALMSKLDQENEYDCIIIRGFALTKEMTKSQLSKKTIPYVTDIPHIKAEATKAELKELNHIYISFPKVFVQTSEAKQHLMDLLHVDGDKFALMTPMIPNYETTPMFSNENNSLIYAGKFAKGWYTEEILAAFKKINSIDPSITMNIVGDKFQGELIPNQEELKQQFKTQAGIHWMGALSRKQSLEKMNDSDIGIAWRSKDVDNENSLELSTKLLEYGQLGKPILLRKTSMHEKLLGSDYELFVDDEDDFVEKTVAVLKDREMYKKAAKQVYEACKQYTFEQSYKRLKPILWSFNKQKTKILFAGHDLKFINLAIDHFKNNDQYEVRIDRWNGHNIHDEQHSTDCLEWADIIFCEWGLGNAVWYSKNKKPDQKLFVRMHAQEKGTNYPKEFNLDNIDRIIAISPFVFEEFHRICQIPREKMVMIYNMIDTQKFDLPKTVPTDELKYNLGICGILPSVKRLDKALNILEDLWKKDKRYKLYVKSRMPQDLPWLMKREEEMSYYNQIFDRIKNEPWGKNVIFDKHGNDVEEWFQKIGIILSTSDSESFHLAPMEGMVAGSIPMVLHWPGAETVYPEENLYVSEKDISDFIHNLKEIKPNAQYPKNYFDQKLILKQIENLITE